MSDSSIPLRLNFFRDHSSLIALFLSALLRFCAGVMSAELLNRLAIA
jgi:hypothetical protein